MKSILMSSSNLMMKAILRSPLHWLISGTTLLIAVIGRKSGCEYNLPVNYVRDGDILYIISSRSHTWWRNLRGGKPVRVCLHGRDLAAEGMVVEEFASISKNLRRFFLILPNHAKYFHVQFDINGRPDERDISRVARECVMVQIGLNGGREKAQLLVHRQIIPNIVLYCISSGFRARSYIQFIQN